MRRAEVDKVWKEVAKDRGFGLRTLRLVGKRPLADGVLSFSAGLTVICGLNGAGKTTTLRLIEAALRGPAMAGTRVREDLISGGQIELTLASDSSEVAFDGSAESEVEVQSIDAFDLCSRLAAIGMQSHFDDLLEGVEPREFSTTDLERLRYVLARDYDVVSVYEVEPFDDDTVLPIFVVKDGALQYDFRSMGLGELAALVTVWGIDRASPNSIVLLEEPETFLSSHGAAALMDILAERIVRRRLSVVVSTHSLDVIRRVPVQNIRVLIASPTSGSSYLAPQSVFEVERLLGTFSSSGRVLLVEDDAAAVLAQELIARFLGLWGQGVELVVMSGAEPIRSVCRLLPPFNTSRVIGVLDGDLEAIQVGLPIISLPGGLPPDRMLQRAVLDDLEAFAHQVGRDLQTATTAIAAISAVNFHDWFERLAEELLTEKQNLLRAAVSVWIRTEGAQDASIEFVQALVSAVEKGRSLKDHESS